MECWLGGGGGRVQRDGASDEVLDWEEPAFGSRGDDHGFNWSRSGAQPELAPVAAWRAGLCTVRSADMRAAHVRVV